MLQKESIVTVSDNSNIITAKILSFYKGRWATVSCFVYLARKKLRRGFVLPEKKKYGLIVGTRGGVRRLSGIKVTHSKNCVVIMNDITTFTASRTFGSFFLETKSYFSAKPFMATKYFV